MLEMLYWTPRYQQEPFKLAMRDFVNTYRDKAATTEDFKAAMEKNMPPWLDVEGNHRLDWFFNEYVYGVEIPSYNATSYVEKKGEETVVHFKVAQSGGERRLRHACADLLRLWERECDAGRQDSDARFARAGADDQSG
jgi:hypothetical protein